MNCAARHVACSDCNLRDLCMPTGLSKADMQRVDSIVSHRQTVRRGQWLFTQGTPFTALYAIRSGVFKTCIHNEYGREQVFGFQMAGEILGFDGIVDERHCCDAIALENAEVCVLPMERLDSLCHEIPALTRHIQRIMSREIVREHGVMQLLGSMRAEERLAAFLVNLAQRLSARGFSSSEVVLRMTREEIGSYLGLKLETVSRAFSKLGEMGLIEVDRRYVRIANPAGLSDMARPQM